MDSSGKGRRRKEILFKAFLTEMIDGLARMSYDADLMRKLLVLYAYDRTNLKPQEIADIFRINEGSIYQWIKRWNEDMDEGLENKYLKKLEERRKAKKKDEGPQSPGPGGP